MSEESWRSVVGFEGLYEVSDLGRVRSLDRLVAYGAKTGRKSGKNRFFPGIIMSPGRASHGYLTVNIGGKSRCVNVLVLEAFVGPAPPEQESCHEDGIRTNNRLRNLRWDTRKNNAADRVRHGTGSKGEDRPGAKLTCEDAVQIRALRGIFSQSALADKFNVSASAIQAVIDGRTWKHAGGPS